MGGFGANNPGTCPLPAGCLRGSRSRPSDPASRTRASGGGAAGLWMLYAASAAAYGKYGFGRGAIPPHTIRLPASWRPAAPAAPHSIPAHRRSGQRRSAPAAPVTGAVPGFTEVGGRAHRAHRPLPLLLAGYPAAARGLAGGRVVVKAPFCEAWIVLFGACPARRWRSAESIHATAAQCAARRGGPARPAAIPGRGARCACRPHRGASRPAADCRPRGCAPPPSAPSPAGGGQSGTDCIFARRLGS